MSQAIERVRAFADDFEREFGNDPRGPRIEFSPSIPLTLADLRELLAGYIDSQHLPAIRAALTEASRWCGNTECQTPACINHKAVAALAALPKETA